MGRHGEAGIFASVTGEIRITKCEAILPDAYGTFFSVSSHAIVVHTMMQGSLSRGSAFSRLPRVHGYPWTRDTQVQSCCRKEICDRRLAAFDGQPQSYGVGSIEMGHDSDFV